MLQKILDRAAMAIGLVALLAIIFMPLYAHATGSVRVEYLRNGVVYSAETVSSSGVSTASTAAPDFGGGVPGQVRVTPIAGAVVVNCCATAPTASQTNGLYLSAGAAPVTMAITGGQKLAVIEAAAGAAAITTSCNNCTGGSVTASLAPSALSAAGVSPVPSTAVEACHVLKAGAGNLYGFTVTTTSTATANDWILVFNATSAPADGTVAPVEWGRISASSQYAWGAPTVPIYFSTGVVVCLSTTGPFTKTAEAQAVISGKVQ